MSVSAEQIETISRRIESSTDALRTILGDMGVGVGTFYDTLEREPTLSERYTRAKERQAELLADELIELSDSPLVGTIETEKIGGTQAGLTIKTADNVERSRLMIETRKWAAAKLLPKKYGDKLDVTSGGEPIKYYVGVDVEKV